MADFVNAETMGELDDMALGLDVSWSLDFSALSFDCPS